MKYIIPGEKGDRGLKGEMGPPGEVSAANFDNCTCKSSYYHHIFHMGLFLYAFDNDCIMKTEKYPIFCARFCLENEIWYAPIAIITLELKVMPLGVMFFVFNMKRAMG